MMPRLAMLTLIAGSVAAGLAGCASRPTIPPVANVDLDRFMGDWYVIAHIPNWPERHAYDAVESYRRGDDGRIYTTFRYRKGSFDEPLSTMHPVATVVPDTGNAVWGMQFVWPIKAEYVIVDLDPDYKLTIIGRSDRDYVWLMARTPTIPDAEFDKAIRKIAALGYNTSEIRMVPQSVRMDAAGSG